MDRTLGDFLTTAPPLTSSQIPGYYAEIPANLEAGVRLFSMDNYTSAISFFETELKKTQDPKEQARIEMWLGLVHGQRAVDYPSAGWQYGTTGSRVLRSAIAKDPAVFEAPDVARVLADLVANGWTEEDPTAALDKYERKAEQTRSAIDFYFAGVIARRLSQRAWSYSDTSLEDRRAMSSFAKAVGRNPGRYESWTAYLRALMPVGMHDLATTEAKKMYPYFKILRTPVLGDQGPAALLMQTASYRTMKQDEELLEEIKKARPDDPYPYFENAMRAIETTAPDALKLFPDFIDRVASGTIKLLPREAGYLPSAYYKLAFIKQQFGDIAGSLKEYRKVAELSENYAEVHMNIAVVLAQLSDAETTGPKKLALLKEAEEHAGIQEKLDFRGRSALKSNELRQKLRQLGRAVQADMEKGVGKADGQSTEPKLLTGDAKPATSASVSANHTGHVH